MMILTRAMILQTKKTGRSVSSQILGESEQLLIMRCLFSELSSPDDISVVWLFQFTVIFRIHYSFKVIYLHYVYSISIVETSLLLSSLSLPPLLN